MVHVYIYAISNAMLMFHYWLSDWCLSVASSMKEPWEEKLKRARKNSPYSHLPNWSIPSHL